jgi:hypothetical protein
MGASSIDRIYTTKEMSDKKIGVENGSSLHRSPISGNAAIPRCLHPAMGKGFWKMNISILSEEAFKDVAPEVGVWRQQRRFYPDWPIW